jgi:hypothetical protein
VTLVRLSDRLPLAPAPAPPPERGRPRVYPERLFLTALVIMILRRLPRVHTLLTMLDQPTPAMAQLRSLLSEQGRFPSRRTWARRLAAMPETVPAQSGCLGRYLVALLQPWGTGSGAAAIDRTVLRAKAGVWHKQYRAAGVVPHTSSDTAAGWTHSGWHGWVYGWKLQLVPTVAGVWLPLAASRTPANRADGEAALHLLDDVPVVVRFLLGDTSDHTPALHTACAAQDCQLVTTKRGKYPHHDAGAAVRSIFHQLRSHAIETFNGQFKAIFDCGGAVPTRGEVATVRSILGAVLVYQLTLLARREAGDDLRCGLLA